ncbi:hypothetical protein PHMEG_00031645 [Phytophthora megakarya]|uniref:Uncharacterized protein n=1 Tax=Phytophthora megakarya TaxID=4795 RepID=A0A225UX74_9STRA|nr:hypothetical protein PHMEG_00031645 [Phytophthora megakarya]
MLASRGTKALRQAWAELAEDMTQLNNGEVVSVEQCRNKLKALRTKWLAYHSGMAPEPIGLALMDAHWSVDKDEAMKSPREARPSPEQPKPSKKPRVTPTSTADFKVKTGTKVLMPIAPAPASTAVPVPAPSTSLSSPVLAAVTTAEPTTTAALQPAAKVNLVPRLNMETQKSANIASTASKVVRPKTIPSLHNENLSKLEKLLDDRFAEVLERQEKQLKLAEVQTELLGQLLAIFQRDERQD